MTVDLAEEMFRYSDTHCTLCSELTGCIQFVFDAFQDPTFGWEKTVFQSCSGQ